MTIAVLTTQLSGCYVTRMAVHHNDLFNSRRPVEDVLADPETPPKTKTALVQVRRILHYAEAQGLNTQGAYRYLIETKEPVVSYIVQAAESDRLEFKTWWFPFVGSVPYLGYFAKSERDAVAADLKAQGYDVNESGAGAFSSLGWFEDPIFSSMLRRGESDLAHLFFHELTHRTLWIPGQPEFNENLAEYVATVVTGKYLVDSGQGSQVAQYEAKRQDRILFSHWLKDLKDDLTRYYDGAKGKSRADVLKGKAEIFARYQKAPQKPAFKVLDYVKDEEWNNASVLGAAMYAPDLERFAKAHACLGKEKPVIAFVDALRARAEDASDAFQALDDMCGKAAVH